MSPAGLLGVGLGQTRDPRVLIPGDPDVLRTDAAAMDAMALSLAGAADDVASLDLGGWTGDAADAFAQAMVDLRGDLLAAAEAWMDAAVGLHAHAITLQWAQDQATVAITRFENAAACTTPDLFGLSGPTPGQVAAEALLVEAREQATVSAATATAALEGATASAPIVPRFWNRVEHEWSEVWHGAAESFTDLGKLAWDRHPVHLLTDPTGYLSSTKDLAEGAWDAAHDPVQLGKDVIDYDTWTTNPSRAVGHLAPDALIAALTAGSGLLATRGAGAAAKTATVAAETAGATEMEVAAAKRLAVGEAGMVGAGKVAAQAVTSAAQSLAERKIARLTDLATRPGMPPALRAMFEGSIFNWRHYHRYTFREVLLERPATARELATNPHAKPVRFRLDSYTPGRAVVSRKHTQLADVTPATAKSYLAEMLHKYNPRDAGLTIADTPGNRTQLGHLNGAIGNALDGRMILEVPVQNAPIPPAILDYADRFDIEIREVPDHG